MPRHHAFTARQKAVLLLLFRKPGYSCPVREAEKVADAAGSRAVAGDTLNSLVERGMIRRHATQLGEWVELTDRGRMPASRLRDWQNKVRPRRNPYL